MKKLLHFLHSSKFVVLFTLVVNVAVFVCGLIFFRNIFIISSISLSFLAIVYMLINTRGKFHSYSVSFATIVFPLFGLSLYASLKHGKGSRGKRIQWNNVEFKSSSVLQPNQLVIDELKSENEYQAKTSNYVLDVTNMPVYQNTSTKFFGDNEMYFNALVDELKRAERYIFIETYILEQGKLWDNIFEVLKIKARQGVEIKIIYDDEGCINRFDDSKTFKKLANYRIDAVAFNPIKLFPCSIENYRNHKKLIVIDGKVGFTGGLNIGDIYLNYGHVFGGWKDAGIAINGEAVWSLAVMFLNDWQFTTNTDVDIAKYKPTSFGRRKSNEWIQPFDVAPFDNDKTARNIYLSLLQNAKKSIYITAPTFIIDAETMLALKMASKGGVDVKIIVPSTPTNKTSYYIARETFGELIRAGVKLYEYSPGFIHEKCLIVDGESAILGNINWEFRESHSRFANGVLIHGGQAVNDVRFDFERTINSCKMLTLKDIRNRKWTEKLISKLLKFVSPIW